MREIEINQKSKVPKLQSGECPNDLLLRHYTLRDLAALNRV